MTQLNKTNQEELEAEKKKVISITIQASNNKVKEKVKRVVQKKKIEPIKRKTNKQVITKISNNKVTKEASTRKRIEVTPKKVMKKTKGKVKETEEEEKAGEYIIEKLVNDRKRKGIWEIEVKWKDHDETTWESMKNIRKDTPEIVEQYMNEMSKKKKDVNKNKKTKTKVKKVDKRCKKKHDMKSSFKMEEDIRYFTANGNKNMMECDSCDLVLMPTNKNAVYLCKDTSCDRGLCFKCYHELRDIKRCSRLMKQLQ